MEKIQCRYDIEGLANDIEVPVSVISELYSEYFLEMKENIEKSITLCRERDWNLLERVIHNMKGISVNLNVTDVYNALSDFDEDLKSGRDDFSVDDIEYINDLYNAAEKDIRFFFMQNDIQI